jgi:hypothetical protein
MAATFHLSVDQYEAMVILSSSSWINPSHDINQSKSLTTTIEPRLHPASRFALILQRIIQKLQENQRLFNS